MAAMRFTVLAVLLSAAAATMTIPREAQVPRTNTEKHGIQTSGAIVVDGVRYDMAYHTILRSGERAAATDLLPFGTVTDENGRPVYKTGRDGNAAINRTKAGVIFGEYEVSDNMDFTSILQVGSRLFSFVHFESPNPAANYLVELKQDAASCSLTAISSRPVNWTSWGGLWTPCAGSVTPWSTHLGSEEYEPDARVIEEMKTPVDIPSPVLQFMRFYGKYRNGTTVADVQRLFNPYRYGHATEMKVNADGSYVVGKHYAMGRIAYELPYVMPDRRTVYSTDDGENVIITMYKAEVAGDLSCGTLFVPKFTQVDAANGGRFNIRWINLGFACNEEIEDLAEVLNFSDIFNATRGDNVTGTCPAGFRSTNSGPLGFECLRLMPGMELAASRLETRRYAAYVGGTTEMSKWEGFTFAREQGPFGTIYTSMSDVRNGMENNGQAGRNGTKFDVGGPNDIRLPYNPCGCVYAMDVNADYNATNLYGVLCGNTRNGTDDFNTCDVNSIASPDNLAYLPGHNALIIGEDTSAHQNDVIWLYQLGNKTLSRVQTTPYGAETTSPYWYPDVNGCAYIMSVIQHPYGESDIERATDSASSGLAGRIGYLGPFASQLQTFSTRRLQGVASAEVQSASGRRLLEATGNL